VPWGWRLAVALAVALLATPGALALDQGSFTFNGVATLDSGGVVEMTPMGLLADHTEQLTAFQLKAAHAHVFRRDSSCTEISTPVLNYCNAFNAPESSYDLTNLTVTLVAGSVAGQAGLYPTEGSLDLGLEGPATIGAVDNARMGSPIPEDQVNPWTPTYSCCQNGSAIVVNGEGAAEFRGAGAIKLDGPSVTLTALENTTTWNTGRHLSSSAPVRGVRETWLTIVFDAGEMTLKTRGPLEAAGRLARLSWVGGVTLPDASGTLTTGSGTYDAQGTEAYLEGTLSGTLHPQETLQGVASSFDVQGTLAHTNLAPHVQGQSKLLPGSIPSWWLPVSLVTVGLAVGAVVALSRRRHVEADPTLSVEALRQLADFAMESNRPAEALDWIRRARDLAPTSSRLCLDEADCLAAMGEIDAALSCYREASRLSEDGEADLVAATLLASTGAEAARVAEFLGRALSRTPTLAMEVELDDTFDRLRASPPIQRLVRDALRKGAN